MQDWDSNESQKSAGHVTVILWLCLAAFITIMIASFIFLNRINFLNDSVENLNSNNEAISINASNAIKTMQNSLGVVIAGTQEAHGRIDRLEKRISEQEKTMSVVRARYTRLYSEFEAMKAAQNVSIDVREETSNPDKDTPDPLVPPLGF